MASRLTHEFVASGALVPVMTRHPPPPAGVYVVRPASQHPSRKVRVLTELLIECFDGAVQQSAIDPHSSV
jgi:DNA-binding transcriptional LysR family regulator